MGKWEREGRWRSEENEGLMVVTACFFKTMAVLGGGNEIVQDTDRYLRRLFYSLKFTYLEL